MSPIIRIHLLGTNTNFYQTIESGFVTLALGPMIAQLIYVEAVSGIVRVAFQRVAIGEPEPWH